MTEEEFLDKYFHETMDKIFPHIKIVDISKEYEKHIDKAGITPIFAISYTASVVCSITMSMIINILKPMIDKSDEEQKDIICFRAKEMLLNNLSENLDDIFEKEFKQHSKPH